MIIFDFHQVFISNLMVQLGNHTNAELEEHLLRHMVLNTIRTVRIKFKNTFGNDVVIASEGMNCWRKESFPYYKANRKKAREKSELDWNLLYTCINTFKKEFRESFGYKVIDDDRAEADDVIATIAKRSSEPVLIVSGDKDFGQLHTTDSNQIMEANQFFKSKKAFIEQYDPTRAKMIKQTSPQEMLQTHIVKGDSIDGIPNILSPDNCLVIGERQKPLRQTRIDKWLPDLVKGDLSVLEDNNLINNYKRNQKLIDFSFIPNDLGDRIWEQFNQPTQKKNLIPFFIEKRLKNLMENIGDF